MGKMQFPYLIAAVVVALACSARATPGPRRHSWNKGPLPSYHVHDHKCSHGEEGRQDGDYVYEDGDVPEVHGRHTCSCLLMAGPRVVFRRQHDDGWYSCSGWGLYRCEQYCTQMFQDENMRFRSRQEACDVFGSEVDTPWYRRNQVCGYNGPYADSALQVNLCCRRGRPSRVCEFGEGEDDVTPVGWDSSWTRALETTEADSS